MPMDQSLKSPSLSSLEDAFHTQLDASRADPAPACEVRIDRLRRLREAVEQNEARFEEGSPAGFGQRSAGGTPLCEVRIDRLRRLREAVEQNEARFEQAISADFGPRSAVETTIAETLFLYVEVKQ